MVFDIKSWGPLGGQASRGAAGQAFTYRSADALATVKATGYFNEVRNQLEIGDCIMFSQSGANLGVNFLTVATAPKGAGAADVTIETPDINSA